MIRELDKNAPASGQNLPGLSDDAPDPLAHISASSIKDYLGCSLRYYFGKVLKVPQPVSPSLLLGRAVHAGIQAYYLALWRTGKLQPGSAIEAYHSSFIRFEKEDGPVEFARSQRQECIDKGVQMLSAYFDSGHVPERSAITGVEVQLREDFPELPSEALGFVDLVYRTKEGLVPVDFKTVANQPNLEQETFLHEVQTVLYQLMVESATGETIAGRELVFLTKHKQPRVVVHRIPRAGPEAVARFWSMAEAAVDGIYHERYYPQPGMACSWCAFRNECSKWPEAAG